ncbi:hypothetical protein GLX30_00905 [Streptomyces sp. Tu 2975]|uniref:DUF6059 family protein n=1 Tax=Streptomyces sp. Tu 2975 TaxID=2676871 RepID=UPI001356DB66|nr:DUF6059 family protein [Streptomyces sp. Tu 2975]QIP82880.1 hypothetical protein GLX30_00905 [Streptomyces sp. Tu 2975]
MIDEFPRLWGGAGKRGGAAARHAVRRVLRVVWRGLVAYGSVHVAGECARAAVEQRPALLSGPATGHPERLRPDVPLSPLERTLLREWGRAG